MRLRTVTALLTGLVTIAAVVIAFVPTYAASVGSLDTVVVDLRRSLRDTIQGTLASFYAAPVRTAQEIGSVFNRGIVDVTQHDFDLVRQVTCPLVFPPRPRGYTGVNVGLQDGFFVTCSLNQASSGGAGTLGSRIRIPRPNTTVPIAQSAPINTTTFRYISPPPTNNPSYDHRTRPFYAPIFASSGAPQWAPLYITSNTPALTVGIPLFSSSSSTAAKIGILMLEFQSLFVSQYLGSIAIGRTGKAVVVHEQSRVVLGNSFNESLVVFPANSSSSVFKYLENYTDPDVRAMLGAVGGDLFALPLAAEFSYGRELDEVFVSSFNVSDSFGLALRVVTLIPARDFIESVIVSRRDTLIGCGIAVVAVIVLAFALSFVAFRPLSDLSERMVLCTTFDDTDPAEPKSALSDVQTMQEAYYTLRGQLQKVRSYVPDSVLIDANDQADGDDVSEGDVKSHATQQSSNAAAGAGAGGTTPNEAQSRRSKDDDARSNSSRKSARNSVHNHGAAVAVARSLNTDASAKQKFCAVLAVNVRRFEALVAATTGVDQVLRLHARITTAIRECVAQQRGVMEGFTGDRFVATFNAANTCASPAEKATLAALALVERLGVEHIDVACGVASGTALVGNLGDDSLRRFTVIGPVYRTALALAQHASRLPAPLGVLMTAKQGADLQHAVYAVPMLRARLPKTVGGDAVLSAVVCRIQHIADEWLYSLQSSCGSSNPFHGVVAAMEALLHDEPTDAARDAAEAALQAHAAALDDKAPHAADVRAALKAAMQIISDGRTVAV